MKHRIFATWLLLSAFGSVSATPVLIDFGTAATAPSLGGTWNSTQTLGAAVALVDRTGAETGMQLTISGNSNTSSESANTWSGGDKDWVDDLATSDYVWEGSGTITVTLSGLVDSLSYDVSVVAVRATAGSRLGTYTVQGLTTSDEVSSADYDAKTGWDNRNILNWTGVTPVSGNIVLSAAAASGQTVYLSAMQIVAIPEPGSLALTGFALALLGLCRCRRR